jgi:hypothetical protein
LSAFAGLAGSGLSEKNSARSVLDEAPEVGLPAVHSHQRGAKDSMRIDAKTSGGKGCTRVELDKISRGVAIGRAARTREYHREGRDR